MITRFGGMAPDPDGDEVACRFARNLVFGPGGSWIETRPGTELVTWDQQPGTDVEAGKDASYQVEDPRVAGAIMLFALGLYNRPGGIFSAVLATSAEEDFVPVDDGGGYYG